MDEDGEGAAGLPGAKSYVVRGQIVRAPTLAPGLYLVATPIGHLDDITLRALDTLAAAGLIACEDTRVTRKLLTRYGISAAVTAYHEHSGPEAARRILAALERGEAVALVSDAGTPLVSDPGFRLVRDAVERGHSVVPVPGASSVLAALAGAGLPTDTFLFAGFLPNKAGQRRSRLEALAGIPATLVLLESPNRIGALLADAAAVLGGAREAAVCREMTKLHETFDRGTLAALAERYGDGPARGEIVLVVAPPGEAEPVAAEDLDERIRAALTRLGVRDAADAVAAETGAKRRDVYQRALALKAGR
ncbi:16S rRNA (cytidine(1402)-2'-O)-methyltransferase [Propylenella binzhouense]|uniref:Ribosomal RNA small subunit methyltransferase I n=1 Tax=Propylenella binzhouense TaxID=2555902 RepID=A0A964T2T8_9HYPH|nr:16S rRNA (cytidine(1402)-2'-O)-methyltransferase [Propylenella binzhouense]MYZ47416.1 16S rRNA (cytidine(1402)-2'-O)-methyltransferase [Propylenella binzhouense]